MVGGRIQWPRLRAAGGQDRQGHGALRPLRARGGRLVCAGAHSRPHQWHWLQDALLAGQSFLASKVWETAADVAMYGALAPHLPKLVAAHPNVSRWVSQMQQSVGAKTGAPSLLSIDLNTPKSIALLMAVEPKSQASAPATGAAKHTTVAQAASEHAKPAKPVAEGGKPAKSDVEAAKSAATQETKVAATQEAKAAKPAAGEELKRKREDKEVAPAAKKKVRWLVLF